MKNFTLSEVRRTHSPVCYLWPIQSASQFISALAWLIVGIGCLAVIIDELDPSVPITGILVSGAIFGCAPLYAVLPARLQLTTGLMATYLVNTVDDYMLDLGYRDSTKDAKTRRYRVACPRWQRWRENEITVAVSGDHTIDVQGPIFALRLLKIRLERAEYQTQY